MGKDFYQNERLTYEGNLLRESLMQKFAAMRTDLIKYYAGEGFSTKSIHEVFSQTEREDARKADEAEILAISERIEELEQILKEKKCR
jgi:hypothetical protein